MATIADKLTMIGLEVEKRRGQGGAARALHHRARDLGRSSIRTPTGCASAWSIPATGDPVQVVCGAPNARAGMKGVFVAARHLHPGQEHHARRRHHPRRREPRHAGVGSRDCRSPTTTTASSTCRTTRRSATTYADWAGLDDPVIEINLTPNRPDCTGVHGIARDLAAADIGKFIEPHAEAGEGRVPLPGQGEARFGATPSLCPASRCGWCAASRTAPRRNGCRSG